MKRIMLEKSDRPEVVILGADQKERGLWGNVFQTMLNEPDGTDFGQKQSFSKVKCTLSTNNI